MTEISRLERELEQAKAELHAENQRGALKDSNKVAELEAKMESLTQQLDVEMRLAETKVYEQRVEESQAEIYNALDNLRVGDKSLRELFLNTTEEEAEAAYQLVSAVWKQETAEIVEKHLAAYQELEQQLSQERKEKSELQARYDELYEEHAEQRKTLNEVRFELEEANAKRDAAANQLQEANEQIKQLSGQIDDLRKEIAVGATNAPKVIDVKDAYENYLEQKKKAEASRPAIYNKRWKDELKKTVYLANLAETGEEIEIPHLEINKYREVTAAEAEVFRAEYEAKRAQESVQVDPGNGLDVTQEQFQTEDTPVAIGGVVEGNVGLEVAREDATLEERVAELERAVFGVVKGAA